MSSELVFYQSSDGAVKLNVNIENETVWLNRQQISALFDRDIKTIGKHITNALREELDGSVVAKFATTAADGKTYQVEHYNLDLIISIGYRVKSKRGVEFRRWANSVLKDYIIKGYAINNNRINQLNEVIRVMKRVEGYLDTKQALSVIEKYSTALKLLDDYDHQNMKRPVGNDTIYVLDYEECRAIIDNMKLRVENNVFGNEKDDSFRGSISAIYQTFGGDDVYHSLEEKAANLLYFITKNHSFSDGNKRIAAAIFLYFLDRNNALFHDDHKLINDYTLVALTIMIAESRPEEKDIMISVVMNCLIGTDL